MHVIAEVTYICPANCEFCPIRASGEYGKNMSAEKFKRVLRLFAEYFENSRKLLTISGGEPTVRDDLPKLVKIAKKLGYTVTVATNCAFPDRLIEAKPDWVQISVDYLGSRHDVSRNIEAWFNIMRVLEWIGEEKLKGFVRFTLMNDNLSDLERLRSRLDALGLSHVKIYAMPIRGCPDRSPSKEAIEYILKKKIAVLPSRCPAGKGQFVVTADFRVLDCIFHRQELGRLEEFSFDELDEIVENGRSLDPYPCGEPYWWAEP